MNIVDILASKFPNAVLGTDIKLRDDGNGVFIAEWNLEGEAPTEQDIEDWSSDASVHLGYLQNQVEEYLRVLVESKPKEKGYDNILTLMSYTNSSNTQWKAEADYFIAWRDSVFEYSYSTLYQVQNNQIPLPTLEEFIAGIPSFTWP